MYRTKIILLVFFISSLMLGTQDIFAQEDDEQETVDITGTVVNEEGEPLKHILLKSFEAGDKTLTNLNGDFTIKVLASEDDQVVIDDENYNFSIVEVNSGELTTTRIVLNSKRLGDKPIILPYQNLTNNRNVSATYSISGDELATYPSGVFLEALAARIPGLQITTYSNNPISESIGASIRGEGVSFYIDGISRNPSDLTVYEIETVHVIKDFAGRSALGLSGLSPVIWITTKTGKNYQKEAFISTETGFSYSSSDPNYLNSFQYATLYNEALVNDGLNPLYSANALAAYENGSDPLYFPDIDYASDYIKKSSAYRRANINFKGGNDKVNYFSLLDYVRTTGLEKIGYQTSSDRFKVRGGANIKLTDKLHFNVNLSGTYQELNFPNQNGGAAQFNVFNYLNRTPPNAHAISYNGNYLVSNDFNTNVENILRNGYAEGYNLNSQNNAHLIWDLSGITEGLSLKGTAAFDIYSNVINSKGGTAALYTLLPNNELQLYTAEAIAPNLVTSSDNFTRSTTALLSLNYERTFGKHAYLSNISHYNGLVETRGFANYQPVKRKDFSFRANYAFDERYILQVDLAYTGSMKLPDGDRYNLYPTLGAAWIASKESFLSDNSVFNYLKFFSSFGVLGNDNFRTGFNTSYNPYYLGTTLWQNVGGWVPGIEGNKGANVNVYNILQEGSSNYELPKVSYLNVGVQGELFKRSLTFEANYYAKRSYNEISQRSALTPSLFGTGGFLPLTNYGETKYWGMEGYLQYTNSIGDFQYSLGGNVMYNRSQYVNVDEPVALEDYRKLSGTDTDLFRGYQALGLYQSQAEIDASGVTQSWGAVQPGDIRYEDYNNDGIIDEKDIHITGGHAPRIYYALNLNLRYKGFGLFINGQGLADGITSINNAFFNGSNPRATYSEALLDRYPVSNNVPRLTTQSQNNYQNSTFWLRDASYFALKNVELSYTLTTRISEKLLIPNLKFFIRAKNIAAFSEFSDYNLNPEYSEAGLSLYPIYSTYTFGISCKL